MKPIGVFDSGVGGLTVFQALERALPDESLIYLGDTARVPYGPKSAETVIRYAHEAAEFMRMHGVKLLVVACNSASAVALEALGQHEIPVIGVIDPGARRAARRSKSGRIGVIGTRATVSSGAYQRAIRAVRPDADVLARSCPLFVPLAEEGWTENDDVARAVAERYLEPFWRADVDTLVLGCTHYPLLRGVIAEVMGPAVDLIDSAASVAAEVRALLDREPAADVGVDTPPSPRLRRAGTVEHHFYVTDVPEPFQQVAERFLGRPLERLERARIEGEERIVDGEA